jgi:surface antigen
MMLEKASQQSLEYGTSGGKTEWKNPDTGNYGYVTPSRVYKNNRGDYCREYTQTIFVGGKEQQAYGKACRQPDGNWEIVQ